MDRTRRLWSLGLALAFVALPGCDDSTGPTAASSEVTLRAYVDVDGSGDFTPGDLPVSGVEATLTSTDGEVTFTESTDAEGLAVFASVPPGSYRASLPATAPEGTVLSTASSPVVVAPFNGAEVTTEFRFVFVPGTIEGVLYRDENANGAFDPGVDTSAPAVPVALYRQGQTDGEPLARTSTDAQGSFSFDRLRPGDYTVVFTPFPSMRLVGGSTQDFSVGADEVTTADVAFSGSVFSDIADARAAAADGSVVAVRGVVTAQPSFSDEVFVEDGTAGIQVFGGAVDAGDMGLDPGDSVIVVGTAGIRFGEIQISDVTAIIPVGEGPAPSPATVTAAEINAGEHQAELVRISGATVVDVDTLSFGNQFVTLLDPAGEEFGVYADSRTDVTAEAWSVGTEYNVTGVVNFDSRFEYPNRIDVRGPSDVQVATVQAIADARAMDGQTVQVEGVVSVDVGAFGTSSFYVQDETGGIAVFSPGVERLSIGDQVRVVGTVSAFNDEVQIGDVTEVTVIGSGTITPVVVGIGEINAGMHQGEVATVEDVTVLAVEVVNSFGTQEVTVANAGGDELLLYVDNRTGITESAWSVGETYDVTGIVSRYRSTFELKPRRTADVVQTS